MGLFLRTFGRTELVSDEQLPPGLTSGRPLLLLVYLALHPRRGFERAYLADLLWGDDRDDTAGKRALRQALYVVRKALPPGSIKGDTWQVRLVTEVPSDAQEMDAALSVGDATRVASLYRGPFLEGPTSDAPDAFLEWADHQRLRYGRSARDLLLRAAEEAIGDGGLDSTAELLEAADRIDGFDLGSELRKVQTWMALGRSATATAVARRALDHCERVGLAVPPETREHLEASALSPPEAGAVTRDESLPRAPQFAGRARERAALLAVWRRAAAGEGVTALVLGDPGVGKSRLIGEVMTQAAADGAIVLEGRSHALESGLLYGALIEVLRQSLDAPGFAGVGSVWLSELSRLLPELRERYTDLALPGPEESGGRRRFYESVAQVFESIAYEQPVFCVLDDLHWADEATLELLHYLGRRLCACKVLLVAGIRPGEASEPLRRLQNALVRERGGVQIELEPLTEAETGDIVSSMFAHLRLPTALSELVWESSEGNPFFAVSMVEALAQRRCVTVAGGDVHWDEACARTVPRLPRRVRELIEARLESLPEAEASLLEVGAVAGSGFTAEVVAAVTRRGLDEVNRGLSSLSRRRLIELRKLDHASRWEFTHDRIREAVYEGLDDDVRAALHADVARTKTSVAQSAESASVARHAALAGDRTSAFQHALEAGRWARSVFAFEGARHMLRVASDNAPDAEARALVESELAELPEAGLAATNGRRWTLASPRTWLVGATLLAIVAIVVMKVTAGRGDATPLPALPTGILVSVQEDGAEHLGVLDPTQPGAPIQRLPEGVLPAFKVGREQTLLSPDGEWVAVGTANPGERPDVYAIRSDGSDTVQLTTNPDDDLPVDWFPDGRAVLTRIGAISGTDGYVYQLGVASMDGKTWAVSPDVLRGDWWWVADAAVSPDGTRLAVLVVGAQQGLWLMDVDGANGERVNGVVEPTSSLAFSPTGTELALFEASGRRLAIVGLEAGSRIGVELRVDGIPNTIVWSGDGERVFFSATSDGNTEVFSVRRDGSDLRRVTYSNASEILAARLGTSPPFVDRVEIIASLPLGTLLAGDSIPIRAVARDAKGAVFDGIGMRTGCVPAEICEVREGWLYGRSEGRAAVVASAGGWRADTLSVEVLDATASLELREDWEHGIDTTTWQAFGDPLPVIVPGGGTAGSAGFQANGDDDWNSGVVSIRTFPRRRGLSIEFWGRGAFLTPRPSWQWLVVGLTGEPLAGFRGDGPHPVVPVTVSLANQVSGNGAMLSSGGTDVPVRTVMEDLDGWHRFVLQMFPQGESELWVDGRLARRGREAAPLPPDVRVVVFGRATRGPVIHDDVRVYEGILLRR